MQPFRTPQMVIARQEEIARPCCRTSLKSRRSQGVEFRIIYFPEYPSGNERGRKASGEIRRLAEFWIRSFRRCCKIPESADETGGKERRKQLFRFTYRGKTETWVGVKVVHPETKSRQAARQSCRRLKERVARSPDSDWPLVNRKQGTMDGVEVADR